MQIFMIIMILLIIIIRIESIDIITNKRRLATILISSSLITSPLSCYSAVAVDNILIPPPSSSLSSPSSSSSSSSTTTTSSSLQQIPNDLDNQLIQMAFRDYNLKRFDEAEKEFTLGLQKWYD